jgi:O-antigen/teichoic acid export membrane protein
MALWMAFGYLLQSFLYLFAWKRLTLTGLIRWASVTRGAVREFATFCFAIFAAQGGGILINALDMPVVAAFDFHSAAYYAMAATVSTMLTVPQAAVVNTLVPIATGISATSNPGRLGSFLLKATRYSSAILCLIVSPLLLGMSAFLGIWVGADYARHALTIATLLVVAQFIRLTLLPYAAIGFAAGQQHRMLGSPVGEGVVNLGCSLVGVRYLGAVGVALGTLVGACVGVLLHFTNSMPRTDEVKLNRLELLTTGILRPIACCIPGFLMVRLLANHMPNSLALAALICAGEAIASFVLWQFNFNLRERQDMVELVKRTLHRLRIGTPNPTVTT